MKTRRSRYAAKAAVRPSFSVVAALLLVCLMMAVSTSVAVAAPTAPVISGPTAVQFITHPLGFRGTLSWEAVPTAASYRVYDADTGALISTVTTPTHVIYGTQGVLYRRYVVAVDAIGDTSAPSNTLSIQSVAPVIAEPPASFDLVANSAFDLKTSAPPVGPASVKVPYNPLGVTGDPADLRLLHYTGTGWEDITVSVDTTYQLVVGMTSSFSVFAVAEPTGVAVFTISPSAGVHGSISPSDVQSVAQGSDSATFTMAPDPGYHVADVLIDGVSVGALTSYKFTNVAANHTIAVSFAADPVTLETATSLSGPASIKLRSELMLSGAVVPASAPGTVTIELSLLDHKEWTSMGSATVAVVDGSFSYSFLPARKGSWRFVATYSGAQDGHTTYSPSVSNTSMVTVR